MSVATITAPIAESTLEFGDGAVCGFDEAGQWLDHHTVDRPEYDREFIRPPGVVDGMMSLTYGYMSRKISMNVIYVADTEAGILAAKVSDDTMCAAELVTVEIDGILFYGCNLEEFSLGPIRKNITEDVCWARATIAFTAKRLS